MSGVDSTFIRAKCEAHLGSPWKPGVTVGSRIAVYASDILETTDTPNPCLGYLTVDPYASVLKVPADTKPFWFPALFYCLIEYLSSPNVAFYCANGC